MQSKVTGLFRADSEEGHPAQRGGWLVENHTLSSLSCTWHLLGLAGPG